jgi:RNA polymerase sigma factor (sigma-70 family)
MDEEKSLTERFEAHRNRLRAVAYRMLGSQTEADDAVQEAWLRLHRSDSSDIDNLGAWLTTVVARVCLDQLRSRQARAQVPLDAPETRAVAGDERAIDPEQELLLADSIGPALLVVLDTLAAAERVAFVLHDLFGIPFEEIATVLGRSPVATRQLASRARRRVQGAGTDPDSDRRRQQEIVDAFLTASRAGDFDALVALLAPDVVVRADELAVRTAAANQTAGAPGLSRDLRGARAVAESFKGRAKGAQRALLDGAPGAVWSVRGKMRAAFLFTVENGRIVEIELAMEPERLAELEVALLDQ